MIWIWRRTKEGVFTLEADSRGAPLDHAHHTNSKRLAAWTRFLVLVRTSRANDRAPDARGHSPGNLLNHYNTPDQSRRRSRLRRDLPRILLIHPLIELADVGELECSCATDSWI